MNFKWPHTEIKGEAVSRSKFIMKFRYCLVMFPVTLTTMHLTAQDKAQPQQTEGVRVRVRGGCRRSSVQVECLA